MSALDGIRQRAEAATGGPWEVSDANEGEWPPRPLWVIANDAFHNPGDDDDSPWLAVELHTGIKEDAEFIAHARTDIPRLLGALDAADKKLSDRMNMLRDTADGFLQAVIDRDVHRDPELANRYDAYARQARAALIAFRAAVNDALEGK